MTTLAGVFIALGLVTAAWIGCTAVPVNGNPRAAVGWVFALLGTIVLLLVALGVVVVR